MLPGAMVMSGPGLLLRAMSGSVTLRCVDVRGSHYLQGILAITGSCPLECIPAVYPGNRVELTLSRGAQVSQL